MINSKFKIGRDKISPSKARGSTRRGRECVFNAKILTEIATSLALLAMTDKTKTHKNVITRRTLGRRGNLFVSSV